MRPVKGVVTGVRGPALVIKLESGITIRVPKVPGLNVGKPVLVSYDFTRDKVKKVLLEEKYAPILEVNVDEPEPLVEMGENDDSDILGSGALPLSVEGCWQFWDLDSGILVLSVPSFEGCGWHDPHS